MASIGLSMIVKNEWEKLDQCLESVRGVFDQIVITVNEENPKHIKKAINSVCLKHNAEVVYHKWENDFAKQRNYAWNNLTTDWKCWLDADDTVIGYKMINRFMEKADIDPSVGIIFIPYHYSFDENGNCNSIQGRERIVRASCGYKWVGALHETLIAPKDYMALEGPQGFYVKHNVDTQHIQEAAARNLEISEIEYERTIKDKEIDPRILYYYGRALSGSGRGKADMEKAIDIFKKYIELSGWDEEKYSAMDHMIKCMILCDRQLETLDWCWVMIQMRPMYPFGYFHLARYFMHIEAWGKVIQIARGEL